jgi:hypothetical protein
MFPGLGLGLLPGLLEDTHNLALKLREFHSEDGAARVQDEIEARGQKIDVAAQSLAHAALNAIALVSLAYDFAYGKADARRGGSERALSCLRGCLRGWLRRRRQKPAHRSGVPLASGSVSAQIVGVLAQTGVRQSLALSRL